MNPFVFAVIGVVFVVIFTREVMAPASRSNCDNRWLIMAGLVNILQMSAAIGAGLVFENWFRGHSIFALESRLNAFSGGLLTFLTASFVAYWWHRAMHKSDFLWRTFHQLHHSPSRIEALTAFYSHPLDSIAATFITCAVAYLLFGLSAASVASALIFVSVFNLYIHSDTASPAWLGYLVQRPEMHRVHHQLDHHAQNYGLPIWDLLFGTWINPNVYVETCGFPERRGERVYDMLMGRDVNV
jgi:sterol desaturase/sphingolipid hydroxylase (fatty acid hydroxylase superfamily)